MGKSTARSPHAARRVKAHGMIGAAALLVGGAALASPAFGGGPGDFTVKGVRPGDPKLYVWTVTNNSDQPIVMFRAPHYLGYSITPPNGWKQTEITGDIVHGQKQAPGIVECSADSTARGIRPGQSATFILAIHWKSTGFTRPQPVTVGLADGTEVIIAGVACLARESFVRRNLALVGLGAMFAIFVAARAIRGRARSRKDPGGPAEAGSE